MNLLLDKIVSGFGETIGKDLYRWMKRSLLGRGSARDDEVLHADVDDDGDEDGDEDGDADGDASTT